MTVELAKVNFVNDMFTTILPAGTYLVLNKVDESILTEGATEDMLIKAINIEIRDTTGNVITCPSVIGIGNELMQITTEHKEYEGEVLTPDNMEFCTIEIYE